MEKWRITLFRQDGMARPRGRETMKVCAGVQFYTRSAEPGSGLMKVLRPHRDNGYWECVHLDGPRKLSIWVRSTAAIEADLARAA